MHTEKNKTAGVRITILIQMNEHTEDEVERYTTGMNSQQTQPKKN